jgi:hypothetical protein
MANFNPENTGTWFYFDESDESQGGICVRTITLSELTRIDKITVSKKDKFKAGVRYEEVKVDEKTANEMRYDYIICDWNNVCISGSEVECTKENKIKLMNDPNFVNFVLKSIDELQDDIESGKNIAKN